MNLFISKSNLISTITQYFVGLWVYMFLHTCVCACVCASWHLTETQLLTTDNEVVVSQTSTLHRQ